MKTMLDALDLNSMANEFVCVAPMADAYSLHSACMRLESPLGLYIAIYNN